MAKAVRFLKPAQEALDWEAMARSQAEQMLTVLRERRHFLNFPTTEQAIVCNRLETAMRIACERVISLPSTPTPTEPAGPPRQFTIFDIDD